MRWRKKSGDPPRLRFAESTHASRHRLVHPLLALLALIPAAGIAETLERVTAIITFDQTQQPEVAAPALARRFGGEVRYVDARALHGAAIELPSTALPGLERAAGVERVVLDAPVFPTETVEAAEPGDDLPRLSASVSKDRGRMVTHLSWELLGVPASVLRDGARIETVDGDAHVDRTGRNGAQTFVYQVRSHGELTGNRSFFAAQVTAQVHPTLAGVVVTGNWTGTLNGSGSCTTEQTGRCTLDLGRVRSNNGGSVTFTSSLPLERVITIK